MHLSKVFLVCLVCTLQLALASITEFGKCPKNIQTMQNFNIHAYAGRWYEYSSYHVKGKLHPTCTYSDYNLLPDGTMAFFMSTITKIWSKRETATGNLALTAPGKLAISMDGDDDLASYWVLGTDYKNYAVVYSCYRLFGFSNKMVYVLTRDASPSKEVIEAAENIVRQNNLAVDSLDRTEHNNCKYD